MEDSVRVISTNDDTGSTSRWTESSYHGSVFSQVIVFKGAQEGYTVKSAALNS
jgi:hypothetical protein